MTTEVATPKWKYAAPIIIGLIVWGIGAPTGLTSGAWLFVSIFAALVVGLILEPVPPAFIGLFAITISVLLRVGPPTHDATGKSLTITAGEAIKWGLSGFLPVGIILFLITPLLAYLLCKPEVKGAKEITAWAKEEYSKLGKMTKRELCMCLISILALVLWVGSQPFGINPTTTALLVIVGMTVTGIITWNDFLGNKPAWNVFAWFGTLIPMAAGLKNVGFLHWVAGSADKMLVGVSVTEATLILLILFCFLRYFFASGSAYVTAMVGLFVALVLQVKGGNPAEIMTILLLPLGIMGILTPYGTGPSPIWFGSGYIKGGEFWKLGFIFGIIYLGTFILIGIPWIHYILPHLI